MDAPISPELTLIAVAGAVVFGASLFQALTGFGFALVSTSILILFVDPRDAVVMLAAPSLAASGLAVYRARADFQWAHVRGYLGWMAVGLPVGIYGLDAVDPRLLKGALALLLAQTLLGPALGNLLAPLRWRSTSGITGGIIAGSLGAPGPAVVAWAHAQSWSFPVKRACTLGIFALVELVRVPVYAARGLYHGSVLRTAALLVAFALLGAPVGGLLARHVGDERAQVLTKAAIVVLVVLLTRSALVEH